MKHADKVIDLLAAFPGRAFVMRQIVRHVMPRGGTRTRMAARKAVQRVLLILETNGCVTVTRSTVRGGSARYTWKSETRGR